MKLQRISVWTVGSYVVTNLLLSTCTEFRTIPSIVVAGIFFLASMAAYAPRRGFHVLLCLLAIGVSFGVSVLLISPFGSAVPQPTGSVFIPITATFLAFSIMLALGIVRSRSLH